MTDSNSKYEDEPKTTLTGRFLPELSVDDLARAIQRLTPPVFAFDPGAEPDRSIAVLLDAATRRIVDAIAIPPEILLSMDTRELELKLIFDMTPLLPDLFMRPFTQLATLAAEEMKVLGIEFGRWHPRRFDSKTRSKGMRRHIRRQKAKDRQ